MKGRISIVMPSRSPVPVGGYKVAYEYANQLASRGWKTSVVHPLCQQPASSFWVRLSRRWNAFFYSRAPEKWVPWFRLAPGVEYLCLAHPQGSLPRADATIATSWETAEWVAETPERHRGKGFYLIQHFEDWSGDPDRMRATWKLPLRKIVIAEWLKEIARSVGEDAVHVPNGLDHSEFGVDASIEMRDPCRIAMLWHEQEWKGSKIGLEALRLAREARPGLKATFFSTFPAPEGLPDWIEFVQNPSGATLRGIYNRASIFLAPSLTEGFGLTPAEAMMCGAAVVATDVGGHREFCVADENCRLVPPGDARAAAAEIARLVGDREERIRLAEAGVAKVEGFTWTRSADLLERALRS